MGTSLVNRLISILPTTHLPEPGTNALTLLPNKQLDQGVALEEISLIDWSFSFAQLV